MVRNILLDLVFSQEIDSHLNYPIFHRLIQLNLSISRLKILLKSHKATLLIEVLRCFSISSQVH